VGPTALDSWATSIVAEIRTPALDSVFSGVTLLGSTVAIAVFSVAVAVAVWWWWSRREAIAVAASLALGNVVLVQGLKLLADRPRPPVADSIAALPHTASLPSGHAFGGLFIAGLVAWIVSRAVPRWRPAAWSLAVVVGALVGLSRVYLGVHWLTDVLAGWALAAAWLGATIWALRLVRDSASRPAASADRST
jgi:undecaprenyl-diphosphatase